MFYLVTQSVAYDIINPPMAPLLGTHYEVLDTDDCVVESYLYEEILEIDKKLGIIGLDHKHKEFKYPKIQCREIQELLGGRIKMSERCNLPPRWLLYNGKKLCCFRRMESGEAGLLMPDGDYILKFEVNESFAIKDIYIYYAEKIGSCYKVRIKSLALIDSGLENNFVFDFYFGEKGLIGVGELTLEYNFIQHIVRNPKYELSESFKARIGLVEASH